MSGNYAIGDGGPTIVSFSGESIDVLISNTGGFPVWLNTTPGTYNAVGFTLPAGATKVWPAGSPLYVQCDPGNSGTINVSENTGVLYAPSPQNTPQVIFQNRDAICANGVSPVGGVGDAWQAPVGGVTLSPPLDVTNYNSVIITLAEVGLNGASYEMRDIYLRWYIKDAFGVFHRTYQENFKHYAIASSSSTESPQIEAHIPIRGTHLQLQVGLVTYVTPVSPQNKYSVVVLGDFRSVNEAVVRSNHSYWWNQENNVIGPAVLLADLGIDNHCLGNTTVPSAGQIQRSFSSMNGVCHMFTRVVAATAVTTSTRIAIFSRDTGLVIGASQFITGATGIVVDQQTIILPNSPMYIQMNNALAAGSLMDVSLKWERF